MNLGRKRLRCEIEESFRQHKYLVTSRLVEKSDKMLMNKIYGKNYDLIS